MLETRQSQALCFDFDSFTKALCKHDSKPLRICAWQPWFWMFYLHPLSTLGWGPFVTQLWQRSGHPLVHRWSRRLARKHRPGHLQLLHPRLRQPLVAPHGDQRVCFGRCPRHASASGEAVGGRGRSTPACAPGQWNPDVQRRESIRGGGVGMVLVAVTQILRFWGRNLGFRNLQRHR